MDDTPVILKKVESIIRHCEHVKDACELLGKRMLESGYDADFCISLIANGRIHDFSKFKGIEFEFLTLSENKEGLKLAIEHHRKINPHHASYWSNIEQVPDLYLAEMTCDLLVRSQEFGTDIREYIKSDFLKKYNLTTSGRVYKKMKEYLDILLEEKFKKLE